MKYGKLFALAFAALPLAGCVEDEIVQPLERGEGGELFDHYVALGNSITAGVQSAGINDSTQLLAYPNLLTNQANARFVMPLFAKPGCPPPYLAPLGQAALSPTGLSGRVGGETAPLCALRTSLPAAVDIQNLAVGGARLQDAFSTTGNVDPTGDFNRQQTFILGGRSQIQALRAQRPTLVSAWLGNNDVLGPALAGNPGVRRFAPDSTLTRLATFRRFSDSLEVALRESGTRDAILLGAVNTNLVPLLQPGAFFFLSRDAAGRFLGKPVNDNCAPAPGNPFSQSLVSFQILGEAAIPEINCANTVAGGALVLTPAEQQIIAMRAAEYNEITKSIADRNGWIYIDPNVALTALLNERDAQGRYQRIRKCQALNAALATGNPAAIQAALVTSCPVPPNGATAPFAAPNFFGSAFSLDGVHPSSEAHRLLTNVLIDALNAKHDLSIPRVAV